MCTARTGVPGADIQRAGTERRRNRQFFSIAQLIVGDRGQQGIHAGIHAIGHLLDVYQPMVNKQVNAKAQFFFFFFNRRGNSEQRISGA
mgnify:CR=1 FL=1